MNMLPDCEGGDWGNQLSTFFVLCVSDLNPIDSFLSAEKTSFLYWCAWRFLHTHQYTLTLVLNNIEKRYMEGEDNPAKVVLIDSKTSFSNRAEATTTEAMRNGKGILSKMPHIAVEYDVEAGKKVFYDNQLPHRGFDGHIRVSSYEGESTSKAAPYANARNSTLENLLPLFDCGVVARHCRL